MQFFAGFRMVYVTGTSEHGIPPKYALKVGKTVKLPNFGAKVYLANFGLRKI